MNKPTKPTRAEAPEAASSLRHYLNRELSLLQFNRRVLELSQDPTVPLLERFRFLTISSSNLDEFFEIRVAGLKQHIAFDVGLAGPEPLSPVEVFQRVSRMAQELVRDQYRTLNEELLPALEREGIFVLRREQWSKPQQEWIRRYFLDEVLPVLTPVGLDPAHPFPRIVNKSLNFIVTVKGKDAFGRRGRLAVVQAPRLFPRLVRLPDEVTSRPLEFVLISSVIHSQVAELFPGMKVTGCSQFRVTRDSDLWVDEEGVDDLLDALKGELFRRRFAGACRLEVADNCSDEMASYLLREFGLSGEDLYIVKGPVNLHRLSTLYEMVDRSDLKYAPFKPGNPLPATSKGRTVFDTIRQGDVLLHHPYQSFLPVVRLVSDAALDPNVLAIKQTVYRAGQDSPLTDALIQAARAGKEVTAVVELRARFDEEANIDLATRLQEAGAKVVYGVVGYKTHSKMLLIVRRENGELVRYAHLGTGNYHTGTTKAYTDLGLLTCDEDICDDVHTLFQQLTGIGKGGRLKKLMQAPFTLHKGMVALIDAETENARAGKKAHIIAKMNSLVEPKVIEALYRASQAGVRVDLIVRGICSLVPGVPGVSENIFVRSILGRFLEHSRIFYFWADGEAKVICSSADWMPRNFFWRVEAGFPIESKRLRRRILEEALKPYLEDNSNAWELQSDGSYKRLTPGNRPPLSAQLHLLETLAATGRSDDTDDGDGDHDPHPLDDGLEPEGKGDRASTRLTELFSSFRPDRKNGGG